MQARWICLIALHILAMLGTSGCRDALASEPIAINATIDPDISAAAKVAREAIGDHRLVLLGEMHGTREIPLFTLALIQDLAVDGRVVLSLEMSRSEQPALDEFMQSEGNAADRAKLRASPWWQIRNDQHDGRRNQDAFDMIEQLRVLRASGRDVRILAFDLAVGVRPGHHKRDVEMAAYLREHVASDASARFLVLTGNVHAMLAKPNRAPPEMQQPMGSYLVDLDPYSIKISANSGEFWGCTTSCSAKAVYPSQQSRALNAREYHFEVVLPEFSVARWLR